MRNGEMLGMQGASMLISMQHFMKICLNFFTYSLWSGMLSSGTNRYSVQKANEDIMKTFETSHSRIVVPA